MANDPNGAIPRQSDHPNLFRGNPEWVKGKSGNPEGVSAYQTKLRKAIEKRETPERVLEVIEAMRQDATAHEKFSPAAAKVYLGAVGINVTAPPLKLDLTEAPDEVVEWIADRMPH